MTPRHKFFKSVATSLVIVGAMMLLAFPLGLEALYHPISDLPGTHIGTAVAFILLALAQFASLDDHRSRLMVCSAGAALIIASWRLVEVATGIESLNAVQKWVMGPQTYYPSFGFNTAVTVVALSAAYLINWNYGPKLSQAFLAGGSFYILVSLTGYVFLIDNFYGEMSPITIALLILVTPGLFRRLSNYSPLKYIAARSTAGRWLRISLLISVFSVYALSWLALAYGEVAAQSFPAAVVGAISIQVGLFLVGAVLIGRSHEALATQADELRDMARRAEAASVAKSQFLATMSHELRTPMTAILGTADLMFLSDLDKEQHSAMSLLTRSARSLLGLLNDILDTSKIESGHLKIEQIPFRLSEVIEDIHNLFVPIASEKGLVFECKLPDEYQDALIGDPTRIRQIITNFTSNAVKFTHKGRITLSFVQNQTAQGVVTLSLSVTDTGIGIPAEKITGLFDPFTQADESTSRKYGGTGLGLAISKKLVDLMSGDISVSSELGKGSTFTFSVPVAVDENVADGVVTGGKTIRKGTADLVKSQVALLAAGGPRKILFAEDNESLRFFIKTMLEKHGHDVSTVENGREAVEALKVGTYDVVLMDMQMPVLSGDEATREIRERESSFGAPRTPIIALTADVIKEHQDDYLGAGCDAIVSKPVDWAALGNEIKRLCGQGDIPPLDREPQSPLSEAQVPHAQLVVNHNTIAELCNMIGEDAVGPMLETCTTNALQYVSDLQNAMNTRDGVQVKKTAHALKGLGMQFGLDKAGEIARSIEHSDDPLKQCGDTFQELEESVRSAVDAIQSEYISSPSSSVG